MLASRFSLAFKKNFPDLLGGSLLAAVSGGPDSTALAHLLAEARSQLGITFAIAHVHHGFRGKEADEDAAFCEQLAGNLRVPFFMEKLSPPPPKVSREAWWREQRYQALGKLQRRFGAAAVATGHTMDDQAETVLFKLFRGSGPRGVAGIRRRLKDVIRPLLDFRRHELLVYLKEKGVGFRLDSSNLVADRPRTFVRWQVLFSLERAFPKVVEHLAWFAEELREDEEFLLQITLAQAPLLQLGRSQPLEKVAALPDCLRRRWLQAQAALLPLQEPPSRRQFSLFCSLLDQGEPKALDLGARWVLARQGRSLTLAPPPIPPFPPVPVACPGIFPLPGGFVLGVGKGVARADHWVSLSPRLQELPLTVTTTPTRFQGRLVRRELARLGVPRQWRAAWPALSVGGTIVWVPGVGALPSWRHADGIRVELEEPWERHGKSSPPKPLLNGLKP